MYSSFARRKAGRPAVDIWPGFVDALSALLMVVIFILMVFMVAQFYLSNLLTGQEQLTTRLNTQIDELSDLLALERDENIELRDRFAQLSLDLQGVVAERDTLAASVTQAEIQTSSLEDQLSAALAQITALTGTGTDLDRQLIEAMATIRDNEATMGGQLRELASLRQDIDALRAVRQGLEVEIAALSLTLEASQAEADRLGIELDETISLRDLLEQNLASAEADNRSLTSDLTDARGEVDLLTADLASSQDEVDWLTNELTSSRSQVDFLTDELTNRDQDLATAQGEIESQALEAEDLTARLQLSAAEVLQLRDFLTAREERIDALIAQTQTLQGEIDTANASLSQRGEENVALTEERDALTVQLRLTEEQRELLLVELGDLRDRSLVLEQELEDNRERTLLVQAELEERDIRIASLVADLSLAGEDVSAAQADRQEAELLATQLTFQIDALRTQLSQVQAALDASESQVSDRDIEIAGLNNRLNQALLREVEELSQYRSEFFGRVRSIVEDRPEIRVEGDRFVFQSGLLFDSASADLREGNSAALGEIARTLIDVANELPEDIDWVLRVDGHTDNQSINNEDFGSNWELSTARATSVVQFLIDQGLPPDRLAAAGFGEWQPLASNDTAAGRESNRRIELKIDQR